MKNLSKFRIRFLGVHVDIDDFACQHGIILFLARKRRYRCVRKRPVTGFVLLSLDDGAGCIYHGHDN